MELENSIYLLLLLSSLSIPLVVTVCIQDYVKNWKSFIGSTLIVALIFLVWDAIFTRMGIWGFDYRYCLGLKILNMPLEEWLFFLVIPFCSLFIHFSIDSAYPSFRLSRNVTLLFSLLMLVMVSVVLILNFTRLYTLVNGLLFIFSLSVGLLFYLELLQRFLRSFLLILIPFFIVNGVLTGMATDSPVVFYNGNEILGIRIITIPIEDVFYAFTMLFANLMIFERLRITERE